MVRGFCNLAFCTKCRGKDPKCKKCLGTGKCTNSYIGPCPKKSCQYSKPTPPELIQFAPPTISKTKCSSCNGNGQFTHNVKCKQCLGTGIKCNVCTRCRGRGCKIVGELVSSNLHVNIVRRQKCRSEFCIDGLVNRPCIQCKKTGTLNQITYCQSCFGLKFRLRNRYM